jgi:hypothetical protein
MSKKCHRSRYLLGALLALAVAVLATCPLSAPVEAAPRQVTICDGQLCVDGVPFEIKGIAYQPYEIGNNLPDPAAPAVDMPMVAELGVNTIRTYHASLWEDQWGTIYDCRDWMDNVLPAAEANGLMVIVGAWPNTNPGADWNNASHRQTWTDIWQDMVNRFKDHPAVLMWGLGNEQIHTLPADQKQAFMDWMEQMIQWTHANDPNHPVFYPDYETFAAELVRDNLPSLDIYGVQSYLYPSIENYTQTVQNAQTVGKPIFFSEWGSDYFDRQSGEDLFQVKATHDRMILAAVTSAGPDSANGYVGHVQFEFDNDHHKNQSWNGHDWGGYSGSSLICGSIDCRDDQEHWGITGAVAEGDAASRQKLPIVFDNTKDYFTNGLGDDVTPPGQVTGLAVTGSGDYSSDLSWDAVSDSDLSHYVIYRSTTPGFNLTKPNIPGYVRTWSMLTVVPAHRTSFTDDNTNGLGPWPGTTYYYRVTAMDTSGNEGTASSEVSGSTTGTAPDPATTMIADMAKLLVYQECFDDENVDQVACIGSKFKVPGNFYAAVKVTNLNGTPVSGASVTADLYDGMGEAQYTISATSDENGWAWLKKTPMTKQFDAGQCFFRVTDISKSGMTFEPNLGYGTESRFWVDGGPEPTATPTPTPSGPTDTPEPSSTPTDTPLPTDTPEPTATPTEGPTPTPTDTPEPTPTHTPGGSIVMHVADIYTTDAGGNPKDTFAKKETVYYRVQILDQSDNPMEGATVSTEILKPDGSLWINQTNATGTGGWALFEKSTNPAAPTGVYTIYVTNVTKDGATYDPNANVKDSHQFTLQ